MIASLRGKVILKDGLYIIVDVSGVGYKVLVSEKVGSGLHQDGNVFLYIYSHIKEDAFDLFGFLEIQDLKLFENLISVNGVGPKTAMSVFSFSSREEIVNAVLKGDVEFFTRVPRLGKKNAQKIIIDLKSKLKDNNILDLSTDDSEANQEVFEALRTFGFSNKEISESLKNIDKTATTTDEKIKLALKYLAR